MFLSPIKRNLIQLDKRKPNSFHGKTTESILWNLIDSGKVLLNELYKLWNLHDPNMRGQVCWSMGKFFRIIGHFAFTVSLDNNESMSEE